MARINENSSLYDISLQYPETIEVFTQNGFPQMADENNRTTMGKSISLKDALKLKQINLDDFINKLETAINISREDGNSIAPKGKNTIELTGALPCPVRLPLLEELDKFAAKLSEEKNIKINYQLQAASMGVEWIEKTFNSAKSINDLPDIFISAGFDLFFDEKQIGKYKRDGAFKNMAKFNGINKSFKNIDLVDPENDYSIISVVPAVFLVNTDELKGRDIPKSWEDVLKPEFENSISLPVGDFDLFNGILINLYKKYGDEALRALNRNLLKAMHPSTMVKTPASDIKPVVSIMPYFFTKLTKMNPTLKLVWPEDGAIISPIFLLAKAEKENELKDLCEFFASKEVGEVLAIKGLFPSLHPEVENPVEDNYTFMWPGWDYIYNNDIAEIIKHCNEVFNTKEFKV